MLLVGVCIVMNTNCNLLKLSIVKQSLNIFIILSVQIIVITWFHIFNSVYSVVDHSHSSHWLLWRSSTEKEKV